MSHCCRQTAFMVITTISRTGVWITLWTLFFFSVFQDLWPVEGARKHRQDAYHALWADSSVGVTTSIGDVKAGDSHLAAQKALNRTFPASRRSVCSDSSPTFSFTSLFHIFWLVPSEEGLENSVHALCQVCLVTEIEIQCSHKFSDGGSSTGERLHLPSHLLLLFRSLLFMPQALFFFFLFFVFYSISQGSRISDRLQLYYSVIILRCAVVRTLGMAKYL